MSLEIFNRGLDIFSDILTGLTLDSSVAKGTWTVSGTWTIPAVTLGGAITGGTQNMTAIGTIAATSLATTAAIPLLLTQGQLVNIALTSQTVGATTLTIPNFASVVDEFTFKTKSQTMANKTLTAPIINGTVTTTGLTLPDFKAVGYIRFANSYGFLVDSVTDGHAMLCYAYDVDGAANAVVMAIINANDPRVTFGTAGGSQFYASGKVILSLPNADPGVSGQLYYVAATGVVMRSP